MSKDVHFRHMDFIAQGMCYSLFIVVLLSASAANAGDLSLWSCHDGDACDVNGALAVPNGIVQVTALTIYPGLTLSGKLTYYPTSPPPGLAAYSTSWAGGLSLTAAELTYVGPGPTTQFFPIDLAGTDMLPSGAPTSGPSLRACLQNDFSRSSRRDIKPIMVMWIMASLVSVLRS
jgi:hypothetical protein